VPKRKGDRKKRPKKKDRHKIEYETRTGTGYEIVEEADVCPKCYLSLTGRKPKKKRTPPKKEDTFKEPTLRQPVKFTKQKKRTPEVEVVVNLPVVTD
jgi:hypothetical protein